MSAPLRGERLEALLSRLPTKPGVYLMKGAAGRVIYVGKAKSLRTRVRSYFRASGDDRPFVSWLDSLLHDIEVVVTPSEKDALILERELIGRHKPRFNINLRDDKNFLSIRIVGGHPFPRLMVGRRRPLAELDSDSGRWFGPYTSAASARRTVKVIQQSFGLRTCSNAVFAQRERPCLLHQMDRCSGPCALSVSEQDYARQVESAVQFLRGRHERILTELRNRMEQAAAGLRYEEAASCRDRMRAIEATLDRRQLMEGRRDDLDALGFYREGASGVIELLQVRRGRWHGAARFPFAGLDAPADDIIRQFLAQHYGPGADLPPVVLAPAQAGGPDELEALSAWLSEQRGGRVRLFVPRRGVPARLMRLATENAGEAFRVRLATTRTLSARLERLQRRLSLGRLPARIECFDMSTSGGRFSVGAMAVLIDGEPAPSAYRRFKIKQAAPDSDVDMMREVVSRRFRPVLEGDEEGPDLVVVDGGRGQLNAVGALFADLGVSDVDLVGLAKSGPGAGRHKADRDRVFVPGRVNPVQLRPDSDELFLLSRVRDEAHRFAIGYHRKLQRKAGVRSALNDIDGVGPVLRKRLLTLFGGLRGVKRADLESLSMVPGVSARLAERIHNFLQDLADH